MLRSIYIWERFDSPLDDEEVPRIENRLKESSESKKESSERKKAHPRIEMD
jgi:hypothetical protein